MPKLIPIITKIDNSQANQELDALEKRFRNLNTITASQNTSLPVGIDTRQLQSQFNQAQTLVSTSVAQIENNFENLSVAINKDLSQTVESAKKAASEIQNSFESHKPTISYYRDVDAAEKQVTSTIEKEANAQKFAKQVAATQAYEKQRQIATKTTSVLTDETKKLLAEEGKVWDAMLADVKRYEKSTLQTNAIIAESEKALANVKKTLAKQTNEIEINEIKKRQAAEKQSSSKGFLTTASEIASIVTAVTLGARAVFGFAQSIYSYGESVFNLVKESAAYATEIDKVQQRTGLAAETITTLRYAAEQTGIEFKDLTQPLNYFANRLGAAAKGSDEARVKMKALGVTNFNDLEGSLDQVFKRIEALPPGIQRMTAATDAFGEDAASKLIPIIDKTKGNFADFKKEAEKLGITMSDSSLKAGRDFTLSYNRLSSLATSLINQFSLGLAPELTNSMDNISAGLSRNKDKFKEWGEEVGQVIRGIKELATSEGGQSLKGVLEGYLYYTNFALVKAIEFLQKTGADAQAEELKKWIRVYQTPISERGKEGVDWMRFPRKKPDTTDYTGNFDLGKKDLTENSSLSSILDAMRRGTMKQESGGRLSAQNSRTGATGWFQVMPTNVPSWTQSAIGQSLTVEQFKSSPTAQIAVFNKYMGEYLEAAIRLAKGNKDIAIRMAAASWYGRGTKDAGKYDSTWRPAANEPSFREYTTSVLKNTKQAMRLGEKAETDVDKIRAELTQAQRDAAIEALETIYQRTGMMPSEEIAKLIADLRNRKASLSKSLTENISSSDVISEFKNNRTTPITTSDKLPDSVQIRNADGLIEKRNYELNKRKTLDEEYIKNLRVSLGLESDRADESTRYTNLAIRHLALAGEIDAKQESYLVSLKEAQTDIEVEYRLLSQRNLNLEAAVKFGQLQNDQYRELIDITVDLDVLNRQNADAQFVEQRRLLSAKREQFDLEQQISSLQDEIANGGINDSLKIQIAQLQDILDLREREVDAVISVNHAQLELAHSMEISNNQIRAGIYEHLAEASNINKSIADGFNKTYDAVADKLTGVLDKLNDKAKGFLSFITEPLKAAERNALAKITTGFIDRIFPPEIADLFNNKSTNNPIAQPIVGEIKTSNEYLKKIATNTAPSPTVSFPTSGSDLHGLVNTIFSGGTSSVSAPFSGGNIAGLLLGGISKLFSVGSSASGGGNLGNRIGLPSAAMNFAGASTAQSIVAPQINQVAETISDALRHQDISAPMPITETGGTTRPRVVSGSPVRDITNLVAGGGFSLGNLAKTLPTLAPMLGLSLGSSLGGSSIGGQILGGLGGLLGGVAAMGLLAPAALTGLIGSTFGIGISASLAVASAATVVGLVAAPLLLLGGWLLGRNKKRKAEEKIHDSSLGDVFSQIDNLIKQVNQDRLDGQSAVAQANSLRQQYVDKMNQLTDKKTRSHALQDVWRIDSRITQLQQASDAQDNRKEAAKMWTPAFNKGGVIYAFADGGTAHPMFAGQMGYNQITSSLPRNFSGRIPGYFDRKDDVHLAVSRGERVIVMTPDQWNVAGSYITPHLQEAGVPGFADGGANFTPSSGTNSRSKGVNIDNFNLSVTVEDGGGITKEEVETILGGREFKKEMEDFIMKTFRKKINGH